MDGIKNQLPLLQEKLQTQGDQMAAIAHRQTDTTEELAKKRDELSKIREKAHQVYINLRPSIYLSACPFNHILVHLFFIYLFIRVFIHPFIDKG